MAGKEKGDLPVCVSRCLLNPECQWFTNYLDQCWQLENCNYLEICEVKLKVVNLVLEIPSFC